MSKILFLLEGASLEKDIFDSVIPLFLRGSNFDREDGVVCIYGTHIYTLYSKMRTDDGLDLVGLLLENVEKYPELQKVADESDGDPTEIFEAIYLLFDYDGHVNMPRTGDGSHIDGDAALAEMLDFFDDAVGNGKLLVSYPMGDAIKYLSDPPASKEEIELSKCKGPHCPNLSCEHRRNRMMCPPLRVFKGDANNRHPEWVDIKEISPSDWTRIFSSHLKVGELLCGDTGNINSQIDIFRIQQRDYISQDCPKVAILSGFPFLFVDFIGIDKLRERLSGM